jgi:glucose-1-phosphate thymidylyltransferase
MREAAEPGGGSLTREQHAAAAAGLKGLIPIGADGRPPRPFLDYVISAVADAGIRQVGLVIGPEHDALRRQYEGDSAPTRLTISFAVQQEALGTADALLAAEGFVAGRPFLSLNADNLYPADVLRTLVALDGPGLPAFEQADLVRSSGMPAERVGSFALLDVGPDGTLCDVIEKPGPARVAAAGPHALVSMNLWRFDGRIFAACRDVARSVRGEFELPDAVRLAIRRGVRFDVVAARGPVLDLSRRDDVPAVTGLLARREVNL